MVTIYAARVYTCIKSKKYVHLCAKFRPKVFGAWIPELYIENISECILKTLESNSHQYLVCDFICIRVN